LRYFFGLHIKSLIALKNFGAICWKWGGQFLPLLAPWLLGTNIARPLPVGDNMYLIAIASQQLITFSAVVLALLQSKVFESLSEKLETLGRIENPTLGNKNV